MNWNEKAEAQADVAYEDWTTKPRYAERRIYKEAAQWQRDQFRTDEAIERVARGIARMEPDEDWDNGHELDLEYKHECFETAIDAITALLGDN